jgi:hypothetical protein
MNWWIVIGVLVVLVVLIVVFIYTSSGSSALSTAHSLTLPNGKVIYSTSGAPIPNTSDGISLVYYATPTGIYSYDVGLLTTTLVSPMVATGLAYVNGLLAIDVLGNFYNLGTTTWTTNPAPIATDVASLSSTIGGYALGITTSSSTVQVTYTGSQTAANGNYGLVEYKVV